MVRYSIISLLSIVLLSGCVLSDTQELPTLIKEIDIPFHGSYRRAYVYKTTSSATVNEAIFVRANKNQKFATHIYERYDSLTGYSVDHDYLTLLLLDLDMKIEKIDTIDIPVDEIFK